MFISESLAKFACCGALITLLAINACTTFVETSESRGVDNLDRLENSSSSLSSRLRVSSLDKENDSNEGNNDVEDEEEAEAEEMGHQEAGNKTFSWKYHPDDHSIYSHRSLMSTSNIEHHQAHETDTTGTPAPTGADGHHHTDKLIDIDDDEYEALRTDDYAEKEWNLMFRSFDGLSDGFADSMLHTIGKQTNLLEEVISRLKPDCKRSINHIKDSIKKHKLWALRMVDSNGKLPSGVTYGRFSSPGDYEECLAVNVDETVYRSAIGEGSEGSDAAAAAGSKIAQEHHKFYGKYCLLDFRLPLPPRPHDKLLSIHEPVLDLGNTELAATYPEIKNYSAYASVFYEIGYLHAVCIPSNCDVVDLAESLGFALEGLHIIVNTTVDCEVKYEGQTVSWTKAQKISITLMVILFLNAAIATIAHFLRTRQQLRQQQQSGYPEAKSRSAGLDGNINKMGSANGIVNKILHHRFYQECFSIQKNFERLTKPDPRGLTFVHYTRIVAMALTVITHTAGMGTLQAITKPADAANSEQIFRDFLPQMLANAFSSIQIFFFMAGFMLVISTYPSIKRDKGHISFPEYVIKRAIRLMPGLAATICLNFLWPLFVDGPMLTYFIRIIVEPCETNWWRTMAFLSNFDHVEKMCLRHSYFSASDYQLHVMAFPLLILLYKHPILSLAIAGLLTLTGFVAQVIMVTTKTVMPFMMVDYIDKEAFFNVVHYIHHPVWNHMSAFFYGFIMGYFVVKQIRINLSPGTIKRTWWIMMPAGIVSIYAPYFWNHYKRPIYRWQMIIYVIVDRLVLLTTCAWLSYATMVLARKPAAKKPVESSVRQGNLNLPDTVTISQAKNQKESPVIVNDMGPEGQSSQSILDDLAGGKSSGYKLTTGLSTTSIPRQRSSPNIMATGEADNDKPYGLRPAVSTVDMSSIQNIAPAATNVSTMVTKQPASNNNQDPVRTQQQPKSRPQAPVSNLNTLCLILSRLTFQLYLFNMVVLWVDVNHSKYSWFFSYYFIITKALAVYIASSLMAMVFFVTLESPSLTLYILWVKSRAQSRADRRTARETPATETRDPATTTNITNIDVNFNSKDSNVSPDSLKQSKLGGGLQMRMGSSVGPTKPTFSFIDLSTPPTSDSHTETPSTINDNQTKM